MPALKESSCKFGMAFQEIFPTLVRAGKFTVEMLKTVSTLNSPSIDSRLVPLKEVSREALDATRSPVICFKVPKSILSDVSVAIATFPEKVVQLARAVACSSFPMVVVPLHTRKC